MLRIIQSSIIIAALSLIPLGGWAMEAWEAFTSAPTEVLPTLDGNTRLDMLDYFNSGSSTPSDNSLGGKSRVLSSSPDKITVRLNDSSTLQIALIPSGRDTVVAIISTLKIPATTSFVEVYSRDWGKLLAESPQPSLKDWTLPAAAKVMDDIENVVPFVTAIAAINTADGTLTLTPTLIELLPAQDYAKVGPYFKPSLKYKWNGRKFILQK